MTNLEEAFETHLVGALETDEGALGTNLKGAHGTWDPPGRST